MTHFVGKYLLIFQQLELLGTASFFDDYFFTYTSVYCFIGLSIHLYIGNAILELTAYNNVLLNDFWRI